MYLFLGEVGGVDAAAEADPARWTPLAVNGNGTSVDEQSRVSRGEGRKGDEVRTA